VAQLVRTAELFGIAEGTARTALSRMSRAGEVAAHDGWYELTSNRLLARYERQSASRRGRTTPWTPARWLQGVVATDGRRPAADRARLRDELRSARLAELREGVWLRPDNLGGTPTLDHQLDWFTCEPREAGTALAARLWDLAGWASESRLLIDRMHTLHEPLARHDHRALADGFVTSAAVLRHFQADPLLPAPLLPHDWPGDELRSEYDRYDTTYRACIATYFRGDW
jgi:phenylacetic acid degradation operon negative regulatory protein